METVYLPKNQSETPSDGESPLAKASQKRKHPRAAGTYPRKRATQACHTCRLRRTKCDNTRPACASCVRLGAECNYQQIDHSTFDSASLAILKRIDDLESLIQSKANDLPALPSNCIPSTSPISFSIGSSVIDQQAQWKPSFINIDEVLKWPVFENHSFDQRLYSLSQSEEDRVQSELPISVDLDLQEADILLRNFFDDVHIFNPTLREEDVAEYVKIVRYNGIGWDATSCLLLLIYAHGSIATPFVKIEPDGSSSSFRQSKEFLQAESYFLAAQKRMGMLLCKTGAMEAQCFFLAGVYLMATLRPVGAWRMFVQALACCQGFSIQGTNDSHYEDEWNTKQRIYWTCFKSELELRLELNLSQKNVLDLSYPTFFPTPPDGLKTKDEAAWYFYLAEIALRRLENRILGHLYRPDAAISESTMIYAIVDFEEQRDAWYRSLPEVLALDIDTPNTDQYEPFRFILRGHFLDCQETMYWHFLVEAIYGRVHGSNDVFLRKGLKVCVDRIQQNRTGFYHRHHGTWLMLRSCTRSALVLLAAERSADLVHLLPLGWEEAILEVTRMLKFWKDESSDVLEMLDIVHILINSRAS
ncbi:uncharacterized protein N7511_009355 [Penicillium nucicola]|uniref:uncharacterized protein n=1 Tax=Penicillium nucicola TaxID=1850975 RepID=UPI0025454924|nr:uncharacterized protein N7511_009355 [Penicillium nucicola]KAJ5747659.1 hypothetical protein N7511_009355 [Penicillium nucicola]